MDLSGLSNHMKDASGRLQIKKMLKHKDKNVLIVERHENDSYLIILTSVYPISPVRFYQSQQDFSPPPLS